MENHKQPESRYLVSWHCESTNMISGMILICLKCMLKLCSASTVYIKGPFLIKLTAVFQPRFQDVISKESKGIAFHS